jgi:tetratricopeptide (TPR) repeat protein
VIVHYLRLCIWPKELCFDYDWPVAAGAHEIAPGLFVIGGLAILTAVGLWRSSRLAYLGLWFFLILAPTSSIVPIRDLAVEHRMYLPSAAVVLAVVLPVAALLLRFARQPLSARQATAYLAVPAAAAVVLLGNMTLARNDDYATDLSIWQDTCRKSPRNARAQLNAATYLYNEHDDTGALGYYQEAIRLDPNLVMAHIGLAQILDQQGRPDAALELCRRATRIEASSLDVYGVADSHAAARRRLAEMLHRHGATEEAEAQYRRAIELQPSNLQARTNLATLLHGEGKVDEAREIYRFVLKNDPRCQPACVSLASSLVGTRQFADAAETLTAGLAINPTDAQMHYQLAGVLTNLGRPSEAAQHYRTAVQLDPDGKVKQRSAGVRRTTDESPQPQTSAAQSGELE